MKISSKILIGLLSTILIVIVAFFLDIRVFGEHRSERNHNKKMKNIPISDFKHVLVDQFKFLKIINSDSNYIQFVVFNDTTIVNFEYAIENDTLKINGESLPSFAGYTLFTNTEIESIVVLNSQINFSGLNQNNIRINLTNSKINNFGNSIKSYFKNAYITQLNSKMFFNNIKVDTLDLSLKDSHAQFGEDINSLKASVDSLSRLDLKYVSKLELVRDKKSKVYMR